MKQKILTVFLAYSFVQLCHASGDQLLTGARATAMGGASVVNIDAFAVFNNQGAAGFIENYVVGVYADRKFLNASVNHFALAAVFHGKKVGNFTLSSKFYGYKLYNETQIGLGYSRKFGEKVAFGIQFDYLRIFIAENGSKHIATAELGLLYKPWRSVFIGFQLYNPIPYKINRESNERLPTIISFGVGYQPSDKVSVNAQYTQDVYYKPGFRAGIEYKPIKYLHLRTGVRTTPFAMAFGVGINAAGLSIDLATDYHLQMGFTPQAALVYTFKKKNKDASGKK